MMDLFDVTEVKEVLTYKQANELLKNGWKLLRTFTFCEDDSLPNHLAIGYVLGFVASAKNI